MSKQKSNNSYGESQSKKIRYDVGVIEEDDAPKPSIAKALNLDLDLDSGDDEMVASVLDDMDNEMISENYGDIFNANNADLHDLLKSLNETQERGAVDEGTESPPPPPPQLDAGTVEDEIVRQSLFYLEKLKKMNSDSEIPPDMDGTIAKFSGYRRKITSPALFNNRPIVFQQIEIINKSFYILMFGVTEDGISVCARVTGFKPYYYYSMPVNYKGNENLEVLRLNLNDAMTNSPYQKKGNNNQGCIDKIEFVNKKNIMYYNNQKLSKYLKLTFPNMYDMRNFEEFASRPNRVLDFTVLEKFEYNVDLTVRFMCDLDIVGCCWVELPAGSWKYIDTQCYFNNKTQSYCQLNVIVPYDKIISHPPTGPWSHIAPLRILSFDIECAGRRGIFPQPNIDPIIQIANVAYLQGCSEPFLRNVFVLNSCAPIEGQALLCFENEGVMLSKWQQFILEMDPDLLTGYNILNFDLPYLLRRALTLGVTDFSKLGRMKDEESVVTERDSFSKQMGNRKLVFINISGRVIFDLFPIVLREHKLRSMSLNAVSFHFLNEKKEDVHHSMITELHNESSLTRRRLAVYCAKDAYLPMQLLNKLMCVINYIEMARVTGVPMAYLITRGQQVKVFSQILRAARKKDQIIPIQQNPSQGAKYEGATVIDPKRGFYRHPIATLDFASLYPSIMIAHNLCFTTLIHTPSQETYKALKLTEDDIEMTPGLNYVFVKSKVYKGILPEILENLLEARKVAKRDLKNESDPQKKKVLDGRQLALKVSANSVYGFTGAQVGKLPCLPISSSVTAYGRQMIQNTSDIVERIYSSATIIYGDTDSVMVDFGDIPRARAMELGKEAAELVSKEFISPIKLEFEKVYHPYLLINKKRYAGLLYTNPDKHDKLDCKGEFFFKKMDKNNISFSRIGIETVRRDNAPIVPELLSKSLETLMIKSDPDAAVSYVKKVIADLLNDRIDISKLIITKELTKSVYKAKQPHAELAEKLRKRDPGSAPKVGDRVSFVICAGDKRSLASTRSEDPVYALDNSIPLDLDYYLQNQISKPVLRIFEPILGEKMAYDILFKGDHMKPKRRLNTATFGPISKFTVIRPSCLNCYIALSGNEIILCSSCSPNGNQILNEAQQNLDIIKKKCEETWDECVKCQGNMEMANICSNRDCGIYFARRKVKIDTEAQDSLVTKLSSLSW